MKLILRFASIMMVISLCILVRVPAISQTLTGAALYHAEENGNYARSEYWITEHVGDGWHLYFRKENQWYNDPNPALNIALTPGLHNLRFYAEGDGKFDYAGLSLFLDGQAKIPAFSVVAGVIHASSEKPGFAVATGQALCADHTITTSSGTLRYERGDILVELLDFRLEDPTVEKTDLVSPYTTQPDGRNDYVGTLTLRVTRRQLDASNPNSSEGAIRFKSLTLSGHNGEVTSAEFSPNGQYLVTCGGNEDKTARVWSTVSGKELFTFYEPPGILTALFSPDSKCVLASIADNRARVWSVENGQVLCTLHGHTGLLSSMIYSPDGKQIATGSLDGTARIWNAKTGQEILVLKGHRGAVLSVAFSRDGTRVVTSSQDKTVKIWDIRMQRK